MLLDGIKLVYIFHNKEEFEQCIEKFPNQIVGGFEIRTGIRDEQEFLDEITGIKVVIFQAKAWFETLKVVFSEKKKYHSDRLLESKYSLKITGSLHGNHFKKRCEKTKEWIPQNYKRFTIEDQRQEIVHICDSIGIQPERLILNPSEFGLNIPFPKNVSDFIERDLLLHRTKVGDRYTGYFSGRKFDNSSYFLKLYDKGKQFDLNYNFLRVEIAFQETKELRKLGINNAIDICDLNKLYRLLLFFFEKIDDLLFFDSGLSIDALPISSLEKRILYKGAYVKNFWPDLLKQKKDKYYIIKDKFKELVLGYGFDWVEKLKELVVDEFIVCAGNDGKRFQFAKKALPKVKSESDIFDKNGIKINALFLGKRDNKNSIYTKRECKECNSDISNKRSHAKFCSRECRNKHNNKINNPKRQRNKYKLNKSEIEDFTKLYIDRINSKRKQSLQIA